MTAPQTVRIRLEPLGRIVEVPRGAPLQDLLFNAGVEFPCGGQAICKGCRVKVLAGPAPPATEDLAAFTQDEIEQGWRLACRLRPEQDIALEIAQWETMVLAGAAAFPFAPGEGAGIAVDLGTTTIAAQVLDLRTGNVLGTRTALNPQAVWGSDVMSRIQAALTQPGQDRLTSAIRDCIRQMVLELSDGLALRQVVLAGNTVMHHLFCGFDVTPLAHAPFESPHGGPVHWNHTHLDWLPPQASLRFLPCLGGFVGSDILAGILATGLHESTEPACLIDLGTNGEIVVGGRDRILCVSTAAGPAFEGGRIRMGMRAGPGAIWRVERDSQGIHCRVLGGGAPRGICGSGLVDAAAVGLDLGLLLPDGRLPAGEWTLAPPVRLFQSDIRQLQLAKAAVSAGARILLRRLGLSPAEIQKVYLAGAFGNYVTPAAACRIGLLPFSQEAVLPSGNTALLGAKLALFTPESGYEDLRRRIEHVPLAADPAFQEIFVEEMAFPRA